MLFYSSSHRSRIRHIQSELELPSLPHNFPTKTKALRKHLKRNQKGREQTSHSSLQKDIFFLQAEKPPSCPHCQSEAGTTFISTLMHTASLHLLLSRAALLLFDEDLFTLEDCMMLRCLIGCRAFHLQVSVLNSSPARCVSTP